MLNVILIDDEKPALKVLERLIKEHMGIEVVGSYTDVFEALNRVEKGYIDVVFLDIEMPKMKGIEVAEKILAIDSTVQVVFVTAYNDYAIDAFELNVMDYIMKPVSKSRLDKTIERIIERKSFEKEFDELIMVSKTDCLTGLNNRRYITERIKNEIVMNKKNKEKFSLIMSDIDYFKKVNDTYGHQCGDFVLKEISKIMMDITRKNDVLARWGGEEFLILLPRTSLKDAKMLAERVRRKIENHVIYYNKLKLHITMTFGVSEFGGYEEIGNCINKVDKALYEGKHSGRNCVIVYR